MIKKPGLLILLCLLLASPALVAASPQSDVGSADWSVKQIKALNAESNDTVWQFMNNLWGNPDVSPGDGKLCSFHFADLRGSGQLSLVVSYDGDGTADCNDVAIFDKVSTGIEDYDFASAGMYWYDSIEDLKSDGRNELIVDGILSAPLGGGHCWATWPIVYTWNGTGYADVSAEFQGFYRKTLTNLQGLIAPPSPSPSPEQQVIAEGELNGANGERLGARVIRPQPVAASTPKVAQDTDCQAAEEAKIERFLGVSRDAGINDAVKWSESDDPAVRKFGATILSDIGTREAIEDLRTLSSDQDPNVARSRKADLKYVNTNTGPIARPTIEGELIPYPSAK